MGRRLEERWSVNELAGWVLDRMECDCTDDAAQGACAEVCGGEELDLLFGGDGARRLRFPCRRRHVGAVDASSSRGFWVGVVGGRRGWERIVWEKIGMELG